LEDFNNYYTWEGGEKMFTIINNCIDEELKRDLRMERDGCSCCDNGDVGDNCDDGFDNCAGYDN
jgi:hypothetical protein